MGGRSMIPQHERRPSAIRQFPRPDLGNIRGGLSPNPASGGIRISITSIILRSQTVILFVGVSFCTGMISVPA